MKLDFDIVLENSKVRLEPLNWEHFESLLLISNHDPDLLKFSPAEFGSRQGLKIYFEANLELLQQQQKCPFAIFDKKQNEFAGSTSFMNISEVDERLEIGSTWLGTKYLRTGLNRNCKYLLMQYAFEKVKCKRIEFKTDNRNSQSKKAIEAIGGKYEGLLRSHTSMPDGFRRDTVCYSVLLNEWNEIRKTIFKEIDILQTKYKS